MFEHDVAISFAGEQRSEAEAIADCLANSQVKVFYDRYEQTRAVFQRHFEATSTDVTAQSRDRRTKALDSNERPTERGH